VYNSFPSRGKNQILKQIPVVDLHQLLQFSQADAIKHYIARAIS